MSHGIRRLLVDLCDDAAVFPPGSLPLPDAVAAYAEHAASAYAPLVGPFVLAANDLDQLAPLVARFEPQSFRLSLTVPLPLLEVALTSVDELRAVRLEALEIAVSDEARPVEVVPALKRALADREVSIFVETGFEQHGFLNVLTATGAALAGAEEAEVVTLLADRDSARVVDRIRALAPEVRAAFRSFGTCSVTEPVEELTELGLFGTHERKVHS